MTIYLESAELNSEHSTRTNRNSEMNSEITTYPPLVSVTVAQTMMGGRGRGRVYELIDSNRIDSVKDGGRRMIVTKSIFAYIKSLEHSREVTEDSN
jgi:hypothetical protein